MKKIDLIVCNPINKNQLAAARQQVEGILAQNPDANLTWLQSSASRTLEGGILAAQHVLTCAVEYEAKAPISERIADEKVFQDQKNKAGKAKGRAR